MAANSAPGGIHSRAQYPKHCTPCCVRLLQFCVLIYHLLVTIAKKEQFQYVTAVGYSCVLFGWMTLLAVKQPGGCCCLRWQ